MMLILLFFSIKLVKLRNFDLEHIWFLNICEVYNQWKWAMKHTKLCLLLRKHSTTLAKDGSGKRLARVHAVEGPVQICTMDLFSWDLEKVVCPTNNLGCSILITYGWVKLSGSDNFTMAPTKHVLCADVCISQQLKAQEQKHNSPPRKQKVTDCAVLVISHIIVISKALDPYTSCISYLFSILDC